MVAEKTDKTASPMLNGGMAEAGFILAGCIGPRVSDAGFLKPKKTAGRTALSNAVHPVSGNCNGYQHDEAPPDCRRKR